MKKLLLIIIGVAAIYYGFNALNKSETSSVVTETTERSEGAITDVANTISDTLEEARAVAGQAGTTTEELEEAGIEVEAEGDTSVESSLEKPSEEAGEEVVATGPGSYQNYGDVDIASLDGKIVLDFYASWCPSCRKLESDINESLDDIPSNLTMLRVDYDSNTELKQKYGVTKQHTMVQIDNQGNLIQKWSGGSTLESIVDKLK